jgi:hypothetical protein
VGLPAHTVRAPISSSPAVSNILRAIEETQNSGVPIGCEASHFYGSELSCDMLQIITLVIATGRDVKDV